jgi:DNA mismatch endonuclease (patch repair protein)
MTDRITPQQRSYNMSRIRAKDTGPELAVRRFVHSQGYRYRVHRHDLPGSPDLVFPQYRKVIFVNGCFWHRHNCPEGQLMPSTNLAYWEGKFAATRKRDIDHLRALHEAGWKVLIIWQCQIANRVTFHQRVLTFLKN